MTDITKRLAEALDGIARLDPTAYTLAIAQHVARKALAGFGRIATQEANVQGGEYLTDGSVADATVTRAAEAIMKLECYAPRGTPDGDEYWRYHGDMLRKKALAALSAAPRPTPAPASGEVTDAQIFAACESLWGKDWRDDGGTLRTCKMRAALEAATRARQGEAMETKPALPGQGSEFDLWYDKHGEGETTRDVARLAWNAGIRYARQAGTVAAQGEAVACDYCGGSGFLNILDSDGESVIDRCDAPAHDGPENCSQCGQPFSEPACGFSHAEIQAERAPVPADEGEKK